MAQARRKMTKRYGTKSSGFRKKNVLKERLSEARLDHFRLMTIRGEYEHVFWHVKSESGDNLGYLEQLLEDEGVGVAPNAAEILEGLARRRVDISRSVGALEKALGNPYAKEHAARALAVHHLMLVNVRKLEGLLKHRDPLIKKVADEIVSQARSQESLKD